MADDQGRVWGLFGLEDPVVHTFDLFAAHYRNALRFHGEHRMNDSILLHSVLPVVQWIDDGQHHRQRNIIYICVEQTMERGGKPAPSLAKAVRFLLEWYDLYFVAAPQPNHPDYAAEVQRWVFEAVGVPSFRHVVLTNRKDLLYGDYLIDGGTDGGSASFMGTRIDFGSETFKTWEEVIEYFSRLGGQ